jgi:prepilin-type N-terminal cleavage/methylation domain-containing protein
MHLPAPDMDKRGVSLVELLIAIAVASVLMAVTFSLYKVVTDSLHDSAQHSRGLDNVFRGMDVLSRDLRCAAQPSSVTGLVFQLIPPEKETDSSSLIFLTTIPDGDEPGSLQSFKVHEVEYRVTEEGLERRLVDQGKVISLSIVSSVTRSLLAEAGGQPATLIGVWPPAPEINKLPPLVRLQMGYRDPRTGEPRMIESLIAVPAAIPVNPVTATDTNASSADLEFRPPLP